MEITGKNIYDLLVARGYGDVITETVLTEVINDINEQTVFEKKMLVKEKNDIVLKAIEILKVNNIEKINVCNFGIYYQMELAGQRISVSNSLLCDLDDDLNNDDLYEEVFHELYGLLNFIDEKYISDVLKYSIDGQNTLVLTHDGFTCEEFDL